MLENVAAKHDHLKRKLKYAPMTGVAALALAMAQGPMDVRAADAQSDPGLPQNPTIQFGVDESGIAYGQDRLDVTQTGSRALVDWESFNVDAGKTVEFHQDAGSWWIVNRVTNAQNPSTISGMIKADGGVAVVSPGGVTINNGATIDVGSFIASSLTLDRDVFEESGRFEFSADGAAGDVSNAGAITVSMEDGGLAALVAPRVSNSGVIMARLGKVALAAGDVVTVDPFGDSLIMFGTPEQVEEELSNDSFSATNTGQLIADGGSVLLTAANLNALVSSVVNTSGTIQAQAAQMDDNGEIVFVGAGGNVDIAADQVDVSGEVDVSGDTGGDVTITGRDVSVSAAVDVLGADAASDGTMAVNLAPGDVEIVTSSQLASVDGRYVAVEQLRKRMDDGDVTVDTQISQDINPVVAGRETDVDNPDFVEGGDAPATIVATVAPEVTVQEDAGDITVSTSVVETSGNDLALAASGDVNVDATVAVKGNLSVEADGDVNLAESVISSEGDVNIDAGGRIAQSSDVYAGESVTLAAEDGVQLAGDSSISFADYSVVDATIDGHHALIINTGGATLELKGNIGVTSALKSLSIISASVNVTLTEHVTEESESTDLISNGGFEEGHNVSNGGWSEVASLGDWYAIDGEIELQKGSVGGAPSNPNSNTVVELDSNGNNSHAPVVQELNLVAGEYTLTFEYAGRKKSGKIADTNGVTVSINTSQGEVASLVIDGETVEDTAANGYTTATYTFTITEADLAALKGESSLDSLKALASGSAINVKDDVAEVVVFDLSTMEKLTSTDQGNVGNNGGGGGNAITEWTDLFNGNHINANRVDDILAALLSEDGVEGVELTNISNSEFAIKINDSDTVIFTGVDSSSQTSVASAIGSYDSGFIQGLSAYDEPEYTEVTPTIAFQGTGTRDTYGTLIDNVSLKTDLVTVEGVSEAVEMGSAMDTSAGTVILPGQINATDGVTIDAIATAANDVAINAGTTLTTTEAVTVEGDASLSGTDMDIRDTVTANNITIDTLTSGIALTGDPLTDVQEGDRQSGGTSLVDRLVADTLTMNAAAFQISGDVSYDGDLTLNSDGDVDFTDVTQLTADSLTLTGGDFFSRNDLTLNATDGDIAVDGESFTLTAFSDEELSTLSAAELRDLGYQMEEDGNSPIPTLTLGADAVFTMSDFFKMAPPTKIEGTTAGQEALTINSKNIHVHHIGKDTQMETVDLNSGEEGNITLGSVYNVLNDFTVTAGTVTLEDSITVNSESGNINFYSENVEQGTNQLALNAPQGQSYVGPSGGSGGSGGGSTVTPEDPGNGGQPTNPQEPGNGGEPTNPDLPDVGETDEPDQPQQPDQPVDVGEQPTTQEPEEDPVVVTFVDFDDSSIPDLPDDNGGFTTGNNNFGNAWSDIDNGGLGDLSPAFGEMIEEGSETGIEPVVVRLFGELEEFVLVDVIDIRSALPSADEDDDDRFQSIGCQCD